MARKRELERQQRLIKRLCKSLGYPELQWIKVKPMLHGCLSVTIKAKK